MDSPDPQSYEWHIVTPPDMMCATTMMVPTPRQSTGNSVRMTASELQRQYEQQVKEHEALRQKIEHERKIREAQKNPLNRLLRWLKKVFGSRVVEI